MSDARLSLLEFPADDPDRARRFWEGLLGETLDDRVPREGIGRQTRGHAPAIGIHKRGRGPGDTASLPYFTVPDMDEAVERVRALGGDVVHPGSAWAVCRDSEGTPFALAAADPAGPDGGS
jgi:predicted enzyme related to lactoylglutathione lyase